MNPDLLSSLEGKILTPDCARGAAVTVEEGYDGLQGRDLAAHFEIDDRCKEEWWESLEGSAAFECEHAIEYRACEFGNLGDFLMGKKGGMMLMPRENDMLVVTSSKPRITER